MAASATVTTAAPRYAPEDPTLPKPWKGLVDGKTGYLYYWNPETNVTQYERPSGSKGSSQPPKSSSVSISSAVQVQQSSQKPQENGFDDDHRYGRSSNGGSKFSSGSRGHESTRSGSHNSHSTPNGGIIAAVPGGTSVRPYGSSAGSGLSPDAYRRRHEITVTGDNVPPPFTSFEDTGFPSELLREVRYLLQGGAKCRTLCLPFVWGCIYSGVLLKRWTKFVKGLSESSMVVVGTSDGDDSVCRLVRLKKRPPAKSRTLCLPLVRGCIYSGVLLNGGPNLSKGFPNHPWSWWWTSYGDDSVCRLVRLKKRPPPALACICKHCLPGFLGMVLQAGFSAPTPIQAQSWPVALQSRDIVAIAKTGSGKTLGYLIPGFIHLKRVHKNRQMGPTVLVLSPTRELATQIQVEALKFGKSSKILCTCLYGGAPKGPQLRELDRGTDIVVATPGRLNDILEMRRISLNQVTYLVLDEADRMLDMGFEPQIRKIVKEIPPRRQTLMYTATWPKEVRRIAADLLVNPVQVNIGNVDELVANKSITQYIEVLAPTEKHRRLEQILRSQEPRSKVIIFCSTKKMCDQLARNLTRQFAAAAIHGDKSQGERDYVLNQFRTGRSPVLVATDVAARGLDIKDIRVVINYDFPNGVEDYVHRIGRTGRAGATGEAYTFFADQDAKHASDLVKVLEGANQRVPAEIRDLASRGGMGGRSRRWGSGNSFGGRDGGRGGRSDSSFGGRSSWAPGRGGGRDSNRGGPGGYHHRSFHEGIVERGRSPPSKAGSGWGRGRSRSRSPERFDKAPMGGRNHVAIGPHEFRPRFHGGEEEEEGMIRE